MYLKQLETFLTIASTGSFVRTAEQLYLSQPTVTQQIQSLESELGFPLLLRKRRRIELTPAGERFLAGARKMVDIYQDTLRSCGELIESAPDCTIHYIGNVNLHQIPILLRTFHEQFPSCHIATRRVRPDRATEMLGSGIIRLLLTPEELIYGLTGITFTLLYEAGYYAVVSAMHPLAQFPSLKPDQLNGYTLLTPSASFSLRHMESVIDSLRESLHCPQRQAEGIDDAFAQLLYSQCVAVMPGYTCPKHPELVPIPLELDRTVPYGIAYKLPLSDLEKHVAEYVSVSFLKTDSQPADPSHGEGNT